MRTQSDTITVIICRSINTRQRVMSELTYCSQVPMSPTYANTVVIIIYDMKTSEESSENHKKVPKKTNTNKKVNLAQFNVWRTSRECIRLLSIVPRDDNELPSN